MSRSIPSAPVGMGGGDAIRARVFAALGDETRLALVARLSLGRAKSIAELSGGTPLTRQAVAKHLHVLADAGIVRSARAGRERRFELDPEPLGEVREYLGVVSRRWDEALSRLRGFVEDGE